MSTRVVLWLLVSLLPAGAWAGITLRQVEVTEGSEEGQNGRRVMRVLADGRAMKTIFEQSPNPMMPAGSYLLSPGGEMVYLVDPAKKTIARMDIEELENIGKKGQQAAEQQQESTGQEFEVVDVKLEKTLDEAGPDMLGFATRHYRYELSYTERQDMRGMPGSLDTRVSEKHEFWSTAALNEDAAVAAIRAELTEAPDAEDKQKEVLDAERQMQAHGLMLKHVLERSTKSGMTGASGLMGKMMGIGRGMSDSSDERTTREVTELKRGPIAAAEFQLPKGYTETELMGPGGAGMPDLDALPGMGGQDEDEDGGGMPDLDSLPR